MITEGKEAKLVDTVLPRCGMNAQELRRRPVLIVKVHAAGGVDGEPGQCEMSLVRTDRNPSTEQPWDVDSAEVTAVMILRDATPARLLSCVRAATGGGLAISAELLGRTMETTREDPSDLQLSGREYEVLRMLADGESTRGIAERLNYSERTVKNIVHDLLLKLNCKTRAHAVALAARRGVI
jgi:DNA-binding CsgD family transcriptional regulator